MCIRSVPEASRPPFYRCGSPEVGKRGKYAWLVGCSSPAGQSLGLWALGPVRPTKRLMGVVFFPLKKIRRKAERKLNKYFLSIRRIWGLGGWGAGAAL